MKFTFFVILFLCISLEVFAQATPSFGIVFLNKNCATDAEKSFISWKFPLVLKSVTSTAGTVSLIDRIEIKEAYVSESKVKVNISGFVGSELYLVVEFIGSPQLALEIKNYCQIKSKANQVFILTASENCLDHHVYKVENYSILNPWRH